MPLRIKEIAKIKGITIGEIADRMDIKRESLSRAINGKPNLETLEKIASALNVELWELFTDSTSKDELTALINHKGEFYKANTLEELEKIVKKIKGNE
ncbi:transcriptional regulator with XRE-family HTH domain [Parabacteroides sp. PF5-5]|uniref:helix-turn-helix domain-containing protein n=1 Tax=unclassified Parabacteroides TaxID=2649774 RepID=UPI002475AA38|nr:MULTISPECIES: helix-turn-helix transcriptional regulator [unclassified Parabacteroides]MDH6304606.1 transcriptional regulator with XRE-family HTH domain [Parabacteroides sp. PH5-39]MDH6315781.1 transcriptional regulator with XRE-family HTH domain [Parabacteroides sp. PF5-13]MDH6319440.1 transcriptional regulator with XRE-family HTH domain [Parabacteroides sp. PH5-13]MDH6323171.1 transcriptional regulator with XRE-family HTH domain [Parabacteroides sp. PH5-8]MDH6326973.1 transcriptional regu